jgi:thiol-disulfide isomerase/thioredoxin
MSDQYEGPVYYDIRSGLWEMSWESAKNFEEFLREGPPELVQRWMDASERAPRLTEFQKQRLTGYNRSIRALMVGAIWCLDCARIAPYLTKIIETVGNQAELRIIDRETFPNLRDELRIMGAPRVPRVVLLSEDWFEIDRLGDRSLSVYRSRIAREIERGEDHGILSPTARQIELAEWVDAFERALIILRTAPALRKRYND